MKKNIRKVDYIILFQVLSPFRKKFNNKKNNVSFKEVPKKQIVTVSSKLENKTQRSFVFNTKKSF